MALSPICVVQDNGGSFNPTAGGINVAPGDTVGIKLSDSSGTTTWFLQVYSTDELCTTPISLANVNPTTHQVTNPTTTVTFTMPSSTGAAGNAIIFLSTAAGPGGPLATTFGIYTPTAAGGRVGAVGQTREGNIIFGWAADVNPVLRSAGIANYQTVQSSTSSETQRPKLNFTGSGVSVADNSSNHSTDVTIPGGYQTVQSGGTPETQRTKLNFLGTGVAVADDSGTGSTDVTIPGGYQTVQSSGSSETQRAKLNFLGAGVSVADNPSNGSTDVTVAGGGGGGGVSLENDGTGVANTPHTTLNLIGWLSATDAGGGVANVSGLPNVVQVNYGTSTGLSATSQIALIGASGSGATTVTMPTVAAPITTGWLTGVIDSGANCLNNNITVAGNGFNIEDPNSPGTFASTIVLRMNSAAVVWMYDGTHWKIAYSYFPRAVTQFFTTGDTALHTVLTIPVPTSSMASIKVRFTARNTVTGANSGAGEWVGTGYNNAGTIQSQTPNFTLTFGTGTAAAGLLWRVPAVGTLYIISFTTGSGTIGVQVQAPSGSSTNWRVDVDTQFI